MATAQKAAGATETENKCCSNHCVANKVIPPGASIVDVKAFEPNSRKQLSAVAWQDGGIAKFHRECWDMLLAATKGTSPKVQIDLSDQERSMILDAKKTAEYHDSDATFAKEAEHIANILKNSGYCIAFTGAGISTAAGIGDFRGIHGKWTERDKVKNHGAKAVKTTSKGCSIESLRPTYTHEALVKLMEIGVLKFLISQNTDGLHKLSGVPADKISELHGNSFAEKCEDCHTRYEKPFAVRRTTESTVIKKKCPTCKLNHRTGRKCTQEGCSGFLMNTIINFGDYLETEIIDTAEHHAKMADAVLILGSTLKVTPASDLVTMGPEPNRLIICNRQTTPYDRECVETGPDGKKLGSRVFGDCDRLMQQVMRNILSPDQLTKWEEGRSARMMEYSMKRTSVG